MLPDGVLSTAPVPSVLLTPDALVESATVDYERGGVAINDASLGIDYQNWRARVVADEVVCGPVGGAEVSILYMPGMTTMSFTFDRNMRPAVTYTVGGVAHLWWYDSTLGGYTDITLDGASTPRLCHDDKREAQSSTADMILAYLKGDDLYYRQQRDRFLVEYLIAEDLPAGRLRNIGMARNNRLQFEIA